MYNFSRQQERGPRTPARALMADSVCPVCGALANKGRCLVLKSAQAGAYTESFAAQVLTQHGAQERKAS